MYTGNYECLELFVKPEAGKKGSVSLKKVKENKTEIKELQHIYGNWIKFPTDKDTEYEITAQDCTIMSTRRASSEGESSPDEASVAMVWWYNRL